MRSGKVVYTLLSPDGKTHALGERLTHDPLNETGTFDGGGATTRAEALTDCTLVLVARREAVVHACRNDAELALGFLAETSQARRRSIDTIADLAFAHVLQRVAKFLLSYAPATTGMATGLARRRESFAGADRRRGGDGARHGGARADSFEERGRRRTRSRTRALDRPRAASKRSRTTCKLRRSNT